MRRTELEELAREFWRKAGAKPEDVERLAGIMVGVAYGEKLLDQEPRR